MRYTYKSDYKELQENVKKNYNKQLQRAAALHFMSAWFFMELYVQLDGIIYLVCVFERAARESSSSLSW